MDENKAKKLMEQDIKISKAMNKIKHKIAIMSGKGGVGKSTVAVNIAEGLSKDFKVGLLDADIHGPNVPRILGLDGNLMVDKEGIIPLKRNNLKVVSMQYLLPSHDLPVIWRGPKKTGAIRQLLSDVKWGNLDVLVVDNPPGTGDEPLTVLQSISNLDGVIIVTTPQSVAIDDVKKCINMVKELNMEVIGIVENMCSFVCPKCGEETRIFGKGNGKELAKEYSIPYLGSIPLDIKNIEALNDGAPVIEKYPDSKISKKFFEIIEKIKNKLDLS
ncbi:ATPase-like, ParA/MinD [Methanothermus fervidus DSM 2088]|uniref:Iron-sulfur cluster carrier protein n=1 Tax=Methanothermus fervidus (strain ATCC 43054 / DSM 2088 / JCM 10308 / V24 S) TaxID=523846 RepID=E3GZ59_METFV|nr:ATPase-like, ParA/MinD [Methanothermus fervidus DSM 2088]